MIARHFIDEGHPPGLVLKYVGLASSTYYAKSKENNRRPGRRPSKWTKTVHGQEVTNDQVVEEIKELLKQEFVDYGYIKVTHWLRQHKGYIINKDKVYRLMSENNLLNKRKPLPRVKRLWVKDLVPLTTTSFEYLEIDIKYIYVHGQHRNALLITIIDVESRWVLGQYMSWNVGKKDVIALFDQLFDLYDWPKKIYVRNDNGSQFIAGIVQKYFEKLKIVQEFIKPATPEQNAHIESYHSIVERVICRQYQFVDLEDAQNTMNRFIEFYNYERIHSGIKYLSPYRHLEIKNVNLPERLKALEYALNCKSKERIANNGDTSIRRRDAEAHSVGKPS